jgi:fermentation-respiration switch protein FrsA (DUF1100 family)
LALLAVTRCPPAATDHRIKTVAAVSGTDIGRIFSQRRDGAHDPAILRRMLDAAGAARTAQACGEGVATFPNSPATGAEARALGDHQFEDWEYYPTERGRHSRGARVLTWSSVDRIAGFDSFAFIHLIAPRPLLMILGVEVMTAWLGRDAFADAKGPKEVFWIEEASHVDLYDKHEYVTLAVAKLDDFFAADLTAVPSVETETNL